MSQVVETDSQALHHLLTEAGVDWDGLTGEVARQWHLLVRRECGPDTPSHYVFSNADASISVSRLARMQGCRFFIEHTFREAKSELAMADYQVRRWDAWHRHMA